MTWDSGRKAISASGSIIVRINQIIEARSIRAPARVTHRTVVPPSDLVADSSRRRCRRRLGSVTKGRDAVKNDQQLPAYAILPSNAVPARGRRGSTRGCPGDRLVA